MNKQWQYYQFHPYFQPQQRQPNPHNHPNNEKMWHNDGREPEFKNEQDSGKVTLAEVIEKLYDKITQVEQENQELKEKVDNMKPITIENVNYKIQDLSVQELSGTLLVGLTSLTDAEELKKLLGENGPVELSDLDTEDVENIIDTLDVGADITENGENNNQNGNRE